MNTSELKETGIGLYTWKQIRDDSKRALASKGKMKRNVIKGRMNPVYDRTKGTLTSLLAVAILFTSVQAMA